MLGGKLDAFSGFVPGVFEEALVTLENRRPLYILGGFGGASEVLANALLTTGSDRPAELTLGWLSSRNSELPTLLQIADQTELPSEARSTSVMLDALFAFAESARSNPSAVLNTGLDDEETHELLTTRSITTAVNLVRKGLVAMEKFEQLPA